MIIYISNEERKGLFNELAEQHEWELLTEVMEKGSLNKYITEKLQVITSLQYLVLERSCVSETDQELNEVIETICVMWDTKVILLMEELLNEEGENQKVIYGDNITSLYKYQDNLDRNIEYLLKGEKIPEEEIYEGIWIGVMSANSGAGATHISIGLANYIRQLGESVCYVEANESGDLSAMAAFYGMEQVEDNHYKRDGIDYWHQSIDPEKKFVILDIGKYGAAKLNLFNQCKIKILITDGRPYRMADALNVLRYIDDEKTWLWLNFSFSDSDEYGKLCEEYLSGLNNVVGNLEWHKDMFNGQDALYQEALSGYINISPVKQSKLTFIFNSDKLKRKGRAKWSSRVLEAKKEANPHLEIEEQEKTESDLVQTETQEKDNQEIYLVSDPEIDWITEDSFEDMDDLEEISEDKETEIGTTIKSTKRVPVKNNLVLFLIIGATMLSAVSFAPWMKQLVSNSFFNNPDTGQTTELVDDNLNINSDIKISVLEVEGADGYEVCYSTDKKFPEERTVVVEVETADKAVESLTAGKTYYVRVRAFKFNEDGTKVYGEYTEVQEIET